MTPYLQDPDVTLYNGDALEVLRTLPDRSVHMCATSPPFYGLRDYGTGMWEGGDEGCDHLAPPGGGTSATGLQRDGRSEEARQGNAERIVENRRQQYLVTCRKCGARRIDNQIGLEESPEQWVARLVEVFREVRRVLRDDGTLWCELGDSYASSWPCRRRNLIGEGSLPDGRREARPPRMGGDLKEKDLIGAPWLLAFALRADGWYLRSEIIWARPNPMPESVTDRPTKAHSTIFLLSKKPRYYFDSEAIREPHQHDGRQVTHVEKGGGSIQHRNGERWPGTGANARSVWWQATEPTPWAHFATWPQKLVQRMILAGTSERGVCPECGAPWVREVESERLRPAAPSGNREIGRWDAESSVGGRRVTSFTGWNPTCECGEEQGVIGQVGTVAHPSIPATILDPFGGSGTTAIVARKLHRKAILIELNESYCALAAERLAQQSLFAEALESSV